MTTLKEYKELISDDLLTIISDGSIDCDTLLKLAIQHIEKTIERENNPPKNEKLFEYAIVFIKEYNEGQPEVDNKIYITIRLLLHIIKGSGKGSIGGGQAKKYKEMYYLEFEEQTVPETNIYKLKPEVKEQLPALFLEWLDKNNLK